MDPVLSFDSVSFSYHSVRGETPAVDNLSFSVNPGEFTVLVGPSGCGKGMVGKWNIRYLLRRHGNRTTLCGLIQFLNNIVNSLPFQMIFSSTFLMSSRF